MLKELFTNIKEKTKEKYNAIKEENINYNKCLETSTTLTNLIPIKELNNKEPSEHKIALITTNCPDINKEKARIINSLIPISETYLDVLYGKEIKTNKELFIIPTNKYLWLINIKEYIKLEYNKLNSSIIKNNIMSKSILLNNILIEINGTNEKINNFQNMINNENIRNNIIKMKTDYLCGIIPTYQLINNISSGISIDNEQNIVFHSEKSNIKCNVNEIENYEILLDNTVHISKKMQNSQTISSFQTSCYQINIRITLKNNQTIIIPILKPNTFGTKYTNTETIYKNNLNFAYSIIQIIQNLLPKY